MSLIYRAIQFAKESHKGQVRKYNGRPYIEHPMRVAGIVSILDEADVDMICSAWLHDVIEDCNVGPNVIYYRFNPYIERIVLDLSNEYSKEKYPDLKREERKRKECERLSYIVKPAKIIKLADRIDNLRDIPHDEPFRVKYIEESKLLLNSLRGVCPVLEKELENIINGKI